MKLTPVESSNISAVGYLEDEQVLLVRYRDGALYAYSRWTAELYAAFLAAESKGKFLAAFGGGLGNFIFISKNKMEVPYVTSQNVGGTDSPPTQDEQTNRDLLALKDIPALLGRSARQTEEKRAAEVFASRKSKPPRPDCSFGVIPK